MFTVPGCLFGTCRHFGMLGLFELLFEFLLSLMGPDYRTASTRHDAARNSSALVPHCRKNNTCRTIS